MHDSSKQLLITLIATASAALAADAQSLTVDLSAKGNDINPDMYGIFFEEINHAGDGGLYAEMVQNRGFEEHVLPTGMVYRDGSIYAPNLPCYADGKIKNWSDKWDMTAKRMLGWRLDADGCSAECDVEVPEIPLHKNTPNAMKIDIGGAGTATIANTGYWGMAVEQGARYSLRFYLCTDAANAARGTLSALKAYVYDVDNATVVAQAVPQQTGNEGIWAEYTATMEASAEAANCELRIELTASAPTLLYIDYVSLFPEDTFMGRKNGMRKDIAETLAALHPQFMRWPGGCIVEGAGLDSRVRWKETLGDPMRRRGEWSLWGYRSTYGIGYHEFLQFCEDLGMDGMFVANAALGCSYRNGDYTDDPEEIERFLQDIRDAIDYATADPATNRWARMRADAGHPDAFPLKYVEIGNENSGEVYVRHFNYMYGKLKEEYPDITFINTMSGDDYEMRDVVKTDMVDPHWYVNPEYFLGANELFDKRKRSDFTVYVGEYACNGGVGSGNMMATLSEAAFMFGMERNSDLVRMASYAPLLTNVNQPNWSCNLIWYDSHRVMGRASYYLQQLMAENRPDYNVGVSVNCSEQVAKDFQTGTVGVGSWSTQSEYRNMRLTVGGTTTELTADDFTPLRGEWESGDGVLRQTGDMRCTLAKLNTGDYSHYTFEAQARKMGGIEGFFLFFGVDADARRGYVFNVGGWNNTNASAQTFVGDNTGTTISPQVPFVVETDRWYDLKVVVDGSLATLYVDGNQICQAREQSYSEQFYIAGYDEAEGEAVIKVANASGEPYKLTIDFQGAQNVEKKGKVITLKADNADDENTLDEPTKIVPVTSSYGKFGKSFSYTFQPYSVTVLRVKCSI